MKVNINQTARVHLTPHGVRLYKEYCRKNGRESNIVSHGAEAPDKPWHIPLWQLMEAFGPHLHVGSQQLFVNNEVAFGE